MDTTTQESFGVLLKRHRIAAGLSQEGLAERDGMSAEAVSALERGWRRTRTGTPSVPWRRRWG